MILYWNAKWQEGKARQLFYFINKLVKGALLKDRKVALCKGRNTWKIYFLLLKKLLIE